MVVLVMLLMVLVMLLLVVELVILLNVLVEIVGVVKVEKRREQSGITGFPVMKFFLQKLQISLKQK